MVFPRRQAAPYTERLRAITWRIGMRWKGVEDRLGAPWLQCIKGGAIISASNLCGDSRGSE